MGRKKIQISRITDERNRQVTFNKRKFGVMKKAYELSVLCDCEIALIIFSSSNKLYQYASTDMDKVLLKYTEYNEPHESLTNKNIIEALNKKEHKNGNCSPESPDPDPEYSLTPRTEAKYNKIDEDFQLMMQRNHMNGSRASMAQSNYNMAVSVPVNSSYGDSTSSLMQQSPQMPHGSVSPRPSSSGTDPGGLLDMSNGYPGSTSPLPGSSSPGLPGKKQNSPGSRPNLRVVIPASASQAAAVTLASQEQPSMRGGGLSSLNTPVVSLQTPSAIPGMPSYHPSTLPNSFATAQDYSNPPELSLTNLSALHSWNPPPPGPLQQGGINPSSYLREMGSGCNLPLCPTGSGLTHLTVSSSTPPPPAAPHSPSPLLVRIKSEPISPPRDANSQLPRPNSTGGGGHLSPSGHLTPTPGHMTPNNHPSPGDPHGGGHAATDYDGIPLQKRPRLTEGWAT